MHGTRTSSAIWHGQLAAVRAAGHEAVAVDLPGHGARSHERFTLDGALETIDRAVQACTSPPVLVGLSLGGYTSLAYAARTQTGLAGLVLSGCSTEIRGKPVAAYRAVSSAIARLLGRQASWAVVADMLGAIGKHSSLGDLGRLHAGGVPVWLVNGQRDPLRLGERAFLAALPGIRHVVVPRAGHDVNTHAPGVFNELLLDVLAQVTPRGSVPVLVG
ncbi:alpha/beta fold hydrolase [Actinotalea sp. C106]|uniref:alpha/beta fold hydrolase n=1 Tax=Actinotalea sp. C106 TaxID=2908644 RepID=UPI0020289D08|nr:alpha/beta fold hydrolase [Actinotalea sp. C106]